MSNLTESQLLLLNNLIYLRDVAVHGAKDIAVGEVVEELLRRNGAGLDNSRTDNEEEIGTINEYPAAISRDQWVEILEAIQDDQQLCNLTITSPVDFEGDGFIEVDGQQVPCKNGMRAATFVDKSSNNATVVFRGTGSAAEWHDNGEGGYLAETTQQEAALAYINSLPDYDYLTATGHSKGGNKAQYVTIRSAKIDRCISFDGQGFSDEFIAQYKKEIKANRHKITSISAANDFVNCLLHSIAGTQIYIETLSQGKDFLCYHAPNIMLKIRKDRKGNSKAQMRNSTEQSDLGKFINRFTLYVMNNVKEPEKSYIIDGLIGKFFECNVAAESIEDQQRALELTKGVMTDFLKTDIGLVYLINIITDDALHDLGFELLRDKLGIDWEIIITAMLSIISPQLFADDFRAAVISKLKEEAEILISKLKKDMLQLADDIKTGASNYIIKVKLRIAIAKVLAKVIKDGITIVIKAEINSQRQKVEKTINTARTYIKKSFQLIPKIRLGKGSNRNQNIDVQLARLEELYNKIKSFQRDYDEQIQTILNDVKKATYGVSTNYDESYVRRELNSIQKTYNSIKKESDEIYDELSKQAMFVQFAINQYRQMDYMLAKSINEMSID